MTQRLTRVRDCAIHIVFSALRTYAISSRSIVLSVVVFLLGVTPVVTNIVSSLHPVDFHTKQQRVVWSKPTHRDLDTSELVQL